MYIGKIKCSKHVLENSKVEWEKKNKRQGNVAKLMLAKKNF